MTRLVTERLVLRRARIADVGDMHHVLSDPAAMTYWSTPPHQCEAETEAWLRSMIESPRELNDDFLVEYRGKVIGKMGAWRLPEFGFILAPEVWGRGLASEALKAFLAYIFTRPDVEVLRADVDPRNSASLRLLERHGFVRTGYARNTWHTHIGACDSVYLELARAFSPAQTRIGIST
jgi:[ribosomal protein S5]-alanine N-acetyltransferase